MQTGWFVNVKNDYRNRALIYLQLFYFIQLLEHAQIV